MRFKLFKSIHLRLLSILLVQVTALSTAHADELAVLSCPGLDVLNDTGSYKGRIGGVALTAIGGGVAASSLFVDRAVLQELKQNEKLQVILRELLDADSEIKKVRSLFDESDGQLRKILRDYHLQSKVTDVQRSYRTGFQSFSDEELFRERAVPAEVQKRFHELRKKATAYSQRLFDAPDVVKQGTELHRVSPVRVSNRSVLNQRLDLAWARFLELDGNAVSLSPGQFLYHKNNLTSDDRNRMTKGVSALEKRAEEIERTTTLHSDIKLKRLKIGGAIIVLGATIFVAEQAGLFGGGASREEMDQSLINNIRCLMNHLDSQEVPAVVPEQIGQKK